MKKNKSSIIFFLCIVVILFIIGILNIFGVYELAKLWLVAGLCYLTVCAYLLGSEIGYQKPDFYHLDDVKNGTIINFTSFSKWEVINQNLETDAVSVINYKFKEVIVISLEEFTKFKIQKGLFAMKNGIPEKI